ncbi:MAG TPA: thiolase domain-containing protein [Candidatus Korarchaeota archaeon]|nr:thiolase domain-containing protein [Candidatus Korarchaeota archaeon]
MRDVAIVGCGMTRFGRLEPSLLELMTISSLRALDDAGLDKVDAIYVANMGSITLNKQSLIASALADSLGMVPVHAETIQNGTASGGSAIKNAVLAIASGLYDTILVTGGEKMRVTTDRVLTDFISTMSHFEAEYIHGITLPALAAMFARLYMRKFGVKQEHLAMVAIKNHENALKNPYAHIQQKISLEGILLRPESRLNNPIISSPLRLYDCCPTSDGAASIILCSVEKAREFSDTPIMISGFGQAIEVHAVHEREDPIVLKALKLASEQAFKMAKVSPNDIDVAELHDAFTILEIAESEDAGFFKKGEGHKALEEGRTQIGGDMPINPSGGLKARGHPVGATGVAQAIEIVWQLRGDAGKRQVEGAEIGFSCNFGGFGTNVLAFVYRRGD